MFGVPTTSQKFEPNIPKLPTIQKNKCHSMFCSRYWHHISKQHSCFLEDTDLLSKMFRSCLNDSSSLFGARLFGNYKKWKPEIRWYVEIVFSKMSWDISCISEVFLWKISGVRIQIWWFVEVPKMFRKVLESVRELKLAISE